MKNKKMKKNIFILFIAIVLHLTSCYTLTYKDYDIKEYDIEERLWKFAVDILENPDKIRNLKNNYPDIYNEEYIYDKLRETSKDANEINELMSYIKNDFANRNYNTEIGRLDFNPYGVDDYKKHIKYQELKRDELYGFFIEKRGKGIRFVFLRNNNKYYILRFTNYTVYSGNSPKYDD